MTIRAIPLAVWIVSCGGDPNGAFPSGSADDQSEEDADEGSPSNSCGDTWSTDNDNVSTQPNDCLLWSSRSEDEMNWHDAASLADGLRGDCGNDCPESAGGYCSDMGPQWRLPTIDEITDAAKTQPDIENVDGWLWSCDTDFTNSQNALTADLSRAGTKFQKPKASSQAWVRCVSDN